MKEDRSKRPVIIRRLEMDTRLMDFLAYHAIDDLGRLRELLHETFLTNTWVSEPEIEELAGPGLGPVLEKMFADGIGLDKRIMGMLRFFQLQKNPHKIDWDGYRNIERAERRRLSESEMPSAPARPKEKPQRRLI